ncbi:hydrogenase maturation protease [Nocardia sp. NPDC005366]|uniref:hydrogenase maturation protease n=1 Tax=Nocardia sp. NPDC005366 TaxID=3156878 RepID=UPI0033BBA2F5
MTAPRAVVIGVGNEFRRDDGVGLVVASELAELGLADVVVTASDGELTELLDIWADAELAIVVDAVRCQPATPGRIRRTGVDALRAGQGSTSSHAFGIQDALALGRVLGAVPGALVVITVEAARVDFGVGLSEPVAAAVPRAVEAVLTELKRAERTTSLPQ